MPVYEYICEECGSFELWHDHRESGAETSCPGCGGPTRRVYSVPTVSDRTESRGELRRRMERGAEPHIERRPKPGNPAPRPRKGGGRPWQIGH